eukprot:4823008-Prymnesium_polylepis.2
MSMPMSDGGVQSVSQGAETPLVIREGGAGLAAWACTSTWALSLVLTFESSFLLSSSTLK